MKTPAAPAAPDPLKTAAAQTGMNRDTAVSQQITNMVNQKNADGSSISYDRSGEESYVDSTGKTITQPRFTQTSAFSAPQQEIFNIGQDTEKNIATIGRDQSGRIGDLLGTPLKLGNEATESRLMELGRKRLDPQFARDEETLRTRMANSGITQGSQAWNAEMGRMGETRNDAMNQLLLSGRQQANQEIMSERNQPINEITALMSGSQVSNPQQNNTPTANVAGVDYTGLVRDNYNAQVAQQQMKNANNQAMMGGLFKLAGTLGSAAISDRRLKSNIIQIGKHESGLPLYSYKVLGRPDVGVMAQEAFVKFPDAVAMHPTGWLMVDYERLAA